jgi:hypothetical protein
MTTQTSDLAAVVTRLEKVERQNRRLKFAGLTVLLLAAGGLLMGQTLPKSRTVEAEEFALRDGDGTRLARLGLVDGLPVLTLFDRTGTTRIRLQVGGLNRTEFTLAGETGQSPGWVTLNVDAQGAGVDVVGYSKELTAASLKVLRRQERPLPILSLRWGEILEGGMSVRPDSLILRDSEGNARAVLGRTELETRKKGVTTNRPISSLVLLNRAGTVLFKAP